jgi:hypothetical protein
LVIYEGDGGVTFRDLFRVGVDLPVPGIFAGRRGMELRDAEEEEDS